MQTYEWNNKYSTGFKPLDDQHKEILCLINNVLRHHDREKEVLLMLLDELKYYVAFHFKSEENMMVLYDYQEYETHRLEHIVIMRELKQKIAQYRDGELPLKKLIVYLIKSSMTHTLEVDRIVGQYLNQVTH